MTEPVVRRENEAAWLDSVAPNFLGPAGAAWRFAEPPDDGDPRLATHLAGSYWLVYAPGAHPFWSWHALMAVSLHEVEGVDPAKKHYPEAEYELMVWALTPEKPVPDPRVWPMSEQGEGRISFLQPPDAVIQFHGTGDEGASQLVELAAKACTTGVLIPDSDHRSAWKESVRKTAEHISTGGHHDG